MHTCAYRLHRYPVSLLLLLLVCQVIVAERYALCIGRNDGGPTVTQLQYAEADAQRLSTVLSTLADIDSSRIQLLLRPDSAAIDQAFLTLNTAIRKSPHRDQALLLVYFSGHADGSNLLLGKQGYPLQRLQKLLSESAAGMRIGILDACRSGMLTAFKGGKRAEPFFADPQPQPQGQIIIASSAATEQAQESQALQASVFSHHFVNGLRGSADLSGDARVTVTEAYQYAFRKTVETTALSGGGVQHPVYKFNITGQGDFVLTDLSQRNGGVLFDRSTAEGSYLVLSESYTEVVADFIKKKGQESFISLAPGPYVAITVAEKQTRQCTFTVSAGATRYLNTDNFSLHPMAINRFKGPLANYHPTPAQVTSPLSTYSFGIGLGAAGVNEKGASPWVTITLNNCWYVNPTVSLFTEGVVAGFEGTGGVDAGVDWSIIRSRPVVSIGAGVGLWHRSTNQRFTLRDLGPACTVRPGIGLDVGTRTRVSLLAPVRVCLGRQPLFIAGAEIRVMWYGRYRDVEVVKE
jgi:hypothetical protein